MKNIRLTKIITTLAIFFIIALQAVWLFQTYKITEAKFHIEITEDFQRAAEKEFMIRVDSIEKMAARTKSDSATLGRKVLFDIEVEGLNLGTNQNEVNVVLQEYLVSEGVYLSIHSLDSIFSEIIYSKGIEGKFIINRIKTDTQEILESSGDNQKINVLGAFSTELIPIRIDKSEGLQLIFLSSTYSIFLQMGYILLLSLLLILFVIFWLLYQLRSLENERNLRQMQVAFSNALTHDMATPLQTIRQVNSLLQSEKLDDKKEKRQKFLDVSQQQVVRLQSLVDRILTIARTEKSKLKLQLESVDLEQVVAQVADRYTTDRGTKKINLSSSFHLHEVAIIADRNLLEDAIGNLVDNAVKYSGEQVDIAIDCRVEENKNLFITVKDNGFGISKKDQEKIFTKFDRGAAVNRKEIKGFGLGLSHVKAVAEGHGGTINLFSVEGEGANFELYIPLADLNDSAAE